MVIWSCNCLYDSAMINIMHEVKSEEGEESVIMAWKDKSKDENKNYIKSVSCKLLLYLQTSKHCSARKYIKSNLGG